MLEQSRGGQKASIAQIQEALNRARAHAEPRPSARDGPRELRHPVLVVNPGKDVQVQVSLRWARAHAERRASTREGPRELRLPVLVINPGKDVVVAQRVSMDRANTGAQLPVLDDYVFHKTSSNADRAPPHIHIIPNPLRQPLTPRSWVHGWETRLRVSHKDQLQRRLCARACSEHTEASFRV